MISKKQAGKLFLIFSTKRPTKIAKIISIHTKRKTLSLLKRFFNPIRPTINQRLRKNLNVMWPILSWLLQPHGFQSNFSPFYPF
jgi:hypothetical protein